MSTAIAKLNTVEDLARIGDVFVKSGFFTDTRDAAQAIVKVMAGQELGFAPIASMTGVYIVKGKVSLSANLIAAAVKRSGRYTFRVRQHDAQICEIEFFELDKIGNKESIGVSSFSMKEAAQAGLASSATWKNFPRNMLYARAMSNGAKWYCPDVFGGPVYTPDELGATIDGETGEVIDIEPSPMPSPIQSAPSPRTLNPAPAPAQAAPLATSEQVEALTIALDELRQNWRISDNDLLVGARAIARMPSLPSLATESLATLTSPQIEAIITRYEARIAELQIESMAKEQAESEAIEDIGDPKF